MLLVAKLLGLADTVGGNGTTRKPSRSLALGMAGFTPKNSTGGVLDAPLPAAGVVGCEGLPPEKTVSASNSPSRPATTAAPTTHGTQPRPRRVSSSASSAASSWASPPRYQSSSSSGKSPP